MWIANRSIFASALLLATTSLLVALSSIELAGDSDLSERIPSFDRETCRRADLNFLENLGKDFMHLGAEAANRGDFHTEKMNAKSAATALDCVYELTAARELDRRKYETLLVILLWAYDAIGDQSRALKVLKWLGPVIRYSNPGGPPGLPDPGPAPQDPYALLKPILPITGANC